MMDPRPNRSDAAPETLTIHGPFRIEYGTDLVFGGDAGLSIFIPIGDNPGDLEAADQQVEGLNVALHAHGYLLVHGA